MIDKATMGRELRRIRKNLNLSIKKAAYSTGLSVPLISDIERGRTWPSYATLFKLAKLYGVAPSQIIRAVEEESVERSYSLPLAPGVRELADMPNICEIFGITAQDLNDLNKIRLSGKGFQSFHQAVAAFLILKGVTYGSR